MEKHNGKITQTCNIGAAAQVEITADMSLVFSKTLSQLPRLHYTEWAPPPTAPPPPPNISMGKYLAEPAHGAVSTRV